jgi:hypothetical protein
MFRTPSLLGPLNSGFVDFSSGAPIDAPAESEARDVLARVSAAAAIDAGEAAPAAVWAPASSARIRIVETVVIAAICGYFGFGLARTLAGF